jgi:hypothetical protein
MLFELPETAERVEHIAQAASEWFQANKRKKLHELISDSRNRGHFKQRLSTIWNSYIGERQLVALSLDNRIKSAHSASPELLAAIQHLRSIPRVFVAEFYQGGGRKIIEFDDLIFTLENMQKFADHFVRPLTRGRKQDPIIEKAAHKLADLYSDLAERPFVKTFTTDDDKRRKFQSDGPEFVRVVLNLIDNDIELRHVYTALRNYTSNSSDKP